MLNQKKFYFKNLQTLFSTHFHIPKLIPLMFVMFFFLSSFLGPDLYVGFAVSYKNQTKK